MAWRRLVEMVGSHPQDVAAGHMIASAGAMDRNYLTGTVGARPPVVTAVAETGLMIFIAVNRNVTAGATIVTVVITIVTTEAVNVTATAKNFTAGAVNVTADAWSHHLAAVAMDADPPATTVWRTNSIRRRVPMRRRLPTRKFLQYQQLSHL